MNKPDITDITGCSLLKTPKTYETYILPEHADIKLPFSRPTNLNEPLPIDDDIIVDRLFKIARTEKDPDPESESWTGAGLD